MTDVPDLARVSVVAPIGNSDHSSLSAVISKAQAVPNLCVSRKVFLKNQVNWNTVCGVMQDLPSLNIWYVDNPVEVLNEHLLLLVGCFVPTKIIRVRNKDKHWFDDQCRHAFGHKQEAKLRWTLDRSRVNWEEFVHCQVRANETYLEAKRQFSARNRDVLMNAQSPHKWWSTLKSACSVWLEFITVTACWWSEVVDWCASRLANMICSRIILMASSPGSLLVCGSLAIRLRDFPPLLSGRVRSLLLLDLDPCGGSDQLGMFPLFLKRTADVLAPRLSVVFGRLVRLPGKFRGLLETNQCHPYSKVSTVLLCCQLSADFDNISIV